jgi:hypothetical protein
MNASPSLPEQTQDARRRIAHRLVELQQVLLALSEDSRALKAFGTGGHEQIELEIAAELVEQFLASTGAFAENMRGRYDTRLGLLRRGEPMVDGKPDRAPGHAAFWMAFSRLRAVLRRLERRSGD